MICERAVDYRALLPDAGVLIGLDLGTRTIGTAFCDAEWHFASPAGTIRRTRFTGDLNALRAVIATRPVRGIVLGLPLHMDGGESPRSQATRAFARNIAHLALPILLWDERLSTVAVERAMIAAEVSRARRAERVDAHAAAHILQAAIDALCRL